MSESTARARLALKRDYITAFSSDEGKRVLAHIMAVSGVTRPQPTAEPSMALVNEGQRRLAHSIFRMVHASTDPLILNMQEELNRLDIEKHHESNQ